MPGLLIRIAKYAMLDSARHVRSAMELAWEELKPVPEPGWGASLTPAAAALDVLEGDRLGMWLDHKAGVQAKVIADDYGKTLGAVENALYRCRITLKKSHAARRGVDRGVRKA